MAVPTVISFSDYDVNETSLMLDIEEDTDNKEGSEEIKEFKIIGIPVALTSVFQFTSTKKNNSHATVLYQVIYNSLELPPPEFS
ncbi:MAG: hypothetical protein ACPGU6_05905 [Tenacibaculum sp.]